MRIKTASPDFNYTAVHSRRQRLEDEYIEPLRRYLNITQEKLGPMIGLSRSHYSSCCVSKDSICPLDILLLYATKLEQIAKQRGAKIPYTRPDIWKE
jgi:hypothetical protein